MCFIFVAPINVIFMRPLYEADIQFDCIINSKYAGDDSNIVSAVTECIQNAVDIETFLNH